MLDADFDPRARWQPGSWSVESKAEALSRTPEFGLRFFDRVYLMLPELSERTVFLSWSAQPEDVYALFIVEAGGCCVQIDPDLEYVILSDGCASAEYGDWNGDQIERSVEFVLTALHPRPE